MIFLIFGKEKTDNKKIGQLRIYRAATRRQITPPILFAVSPEVAIEYVVRAGALNNCQCACRLVLYKGLLVKRLSTSTLMTFFIIALRPVKRSMA